MMPVKLCVQEAAFCSSAVGGLGFLRHPDHGKGSGKWERREGYSVPRCGWKQALNEPAVTISTKAQGLCGWYAVYTYMPGGKRVVSVASGCSRRVDKKKSTDCAIFSLSFIDF